MNRIFMLIFLSLIPVFAGLTPISEYNFFFTNPSISIDSAKGMVYEGGVLPIDSAGTYYLQARLPSNLTSDTKLFLSPSPYAVTLELNGHRIYQWGNGDSTPCLANYNAESVNFPAAFITDTVNTLLISFVSDGARIEFPAVLIGDQKSVARHQFLLTLLNAIGIKIIVGVGFFAFLFLFMYFFTTSARDLNVLFLALFCLSLVAGYNMFVLNSYFFDQVILFKIARVGGAMMSLTIFLFVTSLTGFLSTFLYRLIVSAAFMPYLILILNANSKFQINTIFNAATNTLIFPLLLVGFILLILGLIKSKKVILLAVFIPYLTLMGTVFSDMGYMILFQQPIFWKIPYGYLFVVIGGTFTVLYNRAVRFRFLEQSYAQIENSVSTSETQRKEDVRLNRGFLQQFTMNARYLENSFKTLMDSELPEVCHNSALDIYSRFVLYTVQSNNMLYLDKIKSGELHLWYDGFCISDMLVNKVDAFQCFAEERGVELRVSIQYPSFPQLVWGDNQAVFQIIANSILTAVETEEGSLLVQIRYISYEGLEIIVQGSSVGFSERISAVISSATWNGEVYPVALVLRELLHQLDSNFEIVDSEIGNVPERIRTVLSLKLSEQ